MLLSGFVLQQRCARQRLSPQAHHRGGTACTTMVHLLAGALQHHGPHRVSAAVWGSACLYPGHRPKLALWDGLADHTSATTATQSADGFLPTARPLWLYASCRYRPRRSYPAPPAPGRCDPVGSTGHDIMHALSGGRGHAVSSRWQDGVPQPDHVFHAALAS
jgi:hypothetical protein